MASYHCQVKIISRSAGRSATAAAAYRSGERIECEREGKTHDYTRKRGVEASFIHAPEGSPSWVKDRETLWNKAEEAERRSNARVAREWEVALPHELSSEQRIQLASDYGKALVERYGAAVDVAVHAPHRDGDQRNYHAHIMVTTRKIDSEGFGAKTRVLDDKRTGPKEVETTREIWADMQNASLEAINSDERVDHRSLKAQQADAEARGDVDEAAKLDRPAEQHMGPTVSQLERRERARCKEAGSEYRPVTKRGEEVNDVRRVRDTLFAAIDYIKNARERYVEARKEGASWREALTKSLAQRSPSTDRSRSFDTGKEEPKREWRLALKGQASVKPDTKISKQKDRSSRGNDDDDLGF